MEKIDFVERMTHGTAALPIGIYRHHFDKNNKILFSLHYHREFEFLLITEGNVRLQLENDTVDLIQGEGAFINSGVLHSAVQTEKSPCGFIAVVFSPEFIAQKRETVYEKYVHALAGGRLCVPPRLQAELTELIRDSARIWEAQAFGYELLIKANVTRMMALCVLRAEERPQSKPDHKMILTKSILDYIHQNFRNKISLEELSDYVHVSGEHICRIFKETSGLSPFVYLNRYRILQSTDLILNTDKSISEIALSCGYNDSSYYNKMFKRFMDCTPTQYRKSGIISS